jgi:pyruvate/2-oxoglutarate dehydrogenase complex dihydrolipoamide acyltransferase (E2) component
MVTRVVMPPLGDAEDEATLSRWYKQQGDSVSKGELLFEVETGKASIDIEALGSGVLRRIVVAEGQEAEVGDVLAYIADPDEELPA